MATSEENLKKIKSKLARYLCEKPDKFLLSECFQTIIEFKTKFQKAAHENVVREEKAKKKKQILRTQSLRVKTQSLPRQQTTPNDDSDVTKNPVDTFVPKCLRNRSMDIVDNTEDNGNVKVFNRTRSTRVRRRRTADFVTNASERELEQVLTECHHDDDRVGLDRDDPLRKTIAHHLVTNNNNDNEDESPVRMTTRQRRHRRSADVTGVDVITTKMTTTTTTTTEEAESPTKVREAWTENTEESSTAPLRQRRRQRRQRPLSLVNGLLEKGSEAVPLHSPLVDNSANQRPMSSPEDEPTPAVVQTEEETTEVQMNRFLNPERLIRAAPSRAAFKQQPRPHSFHVTSSQNDDVTSSRVDDVDTSSKDDSTLLVSEERAAGKRDLRRRIRNYFNSDAIQEDAEDRRTSRDAGTRWES